MCNQCRLTDAKSKLSSLRMTELEPQVSEEQAQGKAKLTEQVNPDRANIMNLLFLTFKLQGKAHGFFSSIYWLALSASAMISRIAAENSRAS